MTSKVQMGGPVAHPAPVSPLRPSGVSAQQGANVKCTKNPAMVVKGANTSDQAQPATIPLNSATGAEGVLCDGSPEIRVEIKSNTTKPVKMNRLPKNNAKTGGRKAGGARRPNVSTTRASKSTSLVGQSTMALFEEMDAKDGVIKELIQDTEELGYLLDQANKVAKVPNSHVKAAVVENDEKDDRWEQYRVKCQLIMHSADGNVVKARKDLNSYRNHTVGRLKLESSKDCVAQLRAIETETIMEMTRLLSYGDEKLVVSRIDYHYRATISSYLTYTYHRLPSAFQFMIGAASGSKVVLGQCGSLAVRTKNKLYGIENDANEAHFSNYKITSEPFSSQCMIDYPCGQLAEGYEISVPSFGRCFPTYTSVGNTLKISSLVRLRTCICNEKVGLYTRLMVKSLGTPTSRAEGWQQVLVILNRSFTNLKPMRVLHRSEVEVWASRYKKSARDTKLAIWDNNPKYVCQGATKAFVKGEYTFRKPGGLSKPRIISGKDDEYLMDTGPEYSAWFKDNIEQFRNGHLIYTGGMNSNEIGALVDKFEQMDYIPTECDASSYDGHIEPEALDCEFEFYRPYFLPSVLEQFRLQMHTRGRTANGIKFDCPGKRASGVANTSGGNTILGLGMNAWALEKMGHVDYYVIQAGDDNIIFTRKPINHTEFKACCYQLGHDMKIVDRDYDNLEFCSGLFVDCGGFRTLCPKPFRLLAKSLMCPVLFKTPEDIERHLAAVCIGLVSYDKVSPIFAAIGRAIIERSNTLGLNPKPFKLSNPYSYEFVDVGDVDDDAVRRYFEKRYNSTLDSLQNQLKDFPWGQAGLCVEDAVFDQYLAIDGVIDAFYICGP